MSSEPSKNVPITLRLPAELHDAVAAWAKGDARRPKTSINSAFVFLVTVGLDQQQEPLVAPTRTAVQPRARVATQAEATDATPNG